MNIHLTMKRFLMLSFMMSILLAAILSANAQERLLEGAMILAPIGEAGRMTTASDDTLTACFARIPEHVTPGQRIVAQHNCQEEEATRKLVSPAVKEGE